MINKAQIIKDNKVKEGVKVILLIIICLSKLNMKIHKLQIVILHKDYSKVKDKIKIKINIFNKKEIINKENKEYKEYKKNKEITNNN